MSQFLQKLLTVTIALATAGAQVVCACRGALLSQQPPPPVVKTCAAEKECCRKAELSKQVAPTQQSPCDKCNLKHRAEQAMPDRNDSVLMAHPLLWHLASIAAPPLAEASLVQQRPSEIIESPPALQDLFHVHSLLLI